MALQYFDYTSSGAPTLFGANGKGTTLLDFLLVTKGGWGATIVSGNSRIYTPVTGNTLLYAAHDSTISGAATKMTVRGCEAASGVGTANLTNPFPLSSQLTDANAVFFMDTTAQSAINRPWFALVGPNFLLLAIIIGGNAASVGTTAGSLAVYYFGRPALYDSSDTYGTCIGLSQGTNGNDLISVSAGVVSAGAANTGSLYWDRNHDGTVLSSRGGISAPNTFGALNPGPVFPHPDTLKMYLDKVALSDGASQTSTSGAKSQLVRGWMQNLRFPQHSGYSTANIAPGDTFTDTGYNAAANFLFLAHQLATPFVAIETTDTWAPPA